VSVVEAVAIRVPGQGVVELGGNAGLANKYNGAVLVTPRTLADGTTITSVAGQPARVTVTIPGVGSVVYDGASMVTVNVGGALAGKVCGLCGDFNAVAANDAALVNNNNTWWVVPAAASLFAVPRDRCVENAVVQPTDPCKGDAVKQRAAQAYCAALQVQAADGVYGACLPFVSPLAFYEDCVFDFCAGVGTCDAFSAYEAACAAQGVTAFVPAVDSCGVCHGHDDTCGNTCYALGDPHYYSFDGLVTHWQGQCEYVLARECEVSETSFEVQVRNTARLPGQVVTVTQAVAIRAPVDATSAVIIELFRDPTLNTVNGVPLGAAAVTARGWVSITRPDASRPQDVLVTVAGVGSVRWSSGSRVDVRLAPKFAGRVCGLCGNNDGVLSNDAALVALENHWLVGGAGVPGALFARPVQCAAGADDEQLGSPCDTAAKAAAAAQFCATLLSPTGTYARCAALVNPAVLKELYAACVLDHCGGGSVGACGSYELLEDLCVAAGGAVAAGASVIDACGVCFGDGSSCGGSCTAAGDLNLFCVQL
jgi:hypothetical protein